MALIIEYYVRLWGSFLFSRGFGCNHQPRLHDSALEIARAARASRVILMSVFDLFPRLSFSFFFRWISIALGLVCCSFKPHKIPSRSSFKIPCRGLLGLPKKNKNKTLWADLLVTTGGHLHTSTSRTTEWTFSIFIFEEVFFDQNGKSINNLWSVFCCLLMGVAWAWRTFEVIVVRVMGAFVGPEQGLEVVAEPAKREKRERERAMCN